MGFVQMLIDSLPEPWRTVAWMSMTMLMFFFNLILIGHLDDARTDGWTGAWIYMLFSFFVPLFVCLLVIYRKFVLVSKEKASEQAGLISSPTHSPTFTTVTEDSPWSIYGPNYILIITAPAFFMFLWGIPVVAAFKSNLHNNTAPNISDDVQNFTIVDLVLFTLISLVFLLVGGLKLLDHVQGRINNK